MQLGVALAGAEPEVLRAALGVETAGDGHCLEQGGFARAVLADEKRDRRVELQPAQRADGGEREWIAVEGLDLIPLQCKRSIAGH